ncbi:MAG: hypothetical protein DMG65_00200 [Candidatus Angelobacter sp. Gp1-AA117]|nr:MAG: hypothetical protein DMG65_00200 [Candidatus Angelobacter sp. Gp1-AA117]
MEAKKRPRSAREGQIDYSDAPKLDQHFFATALTVEPGMLLTALGSGKKRQMTLRIDEDVVDFFKSQGKGYQRLMNFALRAYMLRQQSGRFAEDKPLKRRKRA